MQAARWRLIGALSTLVALVTLAPNAHAEEEFELHVAKGHVAIAAKEGWHINLEYPWKLVMADLKLDKAKFTLTEKDATVNDVPAGVGRLRGAVCSHDACHTFDKEVIVP